jgi:glycosyltransferase involved in cell wall biosynthesis
MAALLLENSMRILFLNNLCGHYGGVEQVIAHTVKALVARGHECHFAYGTARPDADEFSRPFASSTRCTEFGGAANDASGKTFREITDAVRPDVVFVHKLAQLPAGVEEARDYRTVVLVHDHDLWCPTGLGYTRHNRKTCTHAAGWGCYLGLAFLEKSEGGPLPVKLVNIERKFREMARYHNFDAILANSSFVRDRLLAGGYPSSRMHLCHPVLDQGEVEVTAVPEAPEILYVGSLIRGKGVDLLLDALHLLRCPFHLTVVGRGKSEDELKGQVKALGLEDRVTFAGWVANDKVGDYYQRARVVAVPSAWPEPFGLVGLEAMRYGRPVAAFAVGGIPDWLIHEETGLLSPEQDVTSLATSLERLLTDDALAARLGAGGALRVREHFSFSGYVEVLEGYMRNSE